MLYNLPNGKTIYLTIEEYLSLTDEDIQSFIAFKSGVHLSPFYDSAVNTRERADEDLIDLDYIPDDLKDDHSSGSNANYYEEDYYEDDYDFLDPTSIE